MSTFSPPPDASDIVCRVFGFDAYLYSSDAKAPSLLNEFVLLDERYDYNPSCVQAKASSGSHTALSCFCIIKKHTFHLKSIVKDADSYKPNGVHGPLVRPRLTSVRTWLDYR